MKKLFELAYYDNKTLIVERHWAHTKMEARGFVVHRLKRQIDFDYVKDVEEVSA